MNKRLRRHGDFIEERRDDPEKQQKLVLVSFFLKQVGWTGSLSFQRDCCHLTVGAEDLFSGVRAEQKAKDTADKP